MQKMIPALTERQRYWLEHIQACKDSGKTIAEYAAAHFIRLAFIHGRKEPTVITGPDFPTEPNRYMTVNDNPGLKGQASPNISPIRRQNPCNPI